METDPGASIDKHFANIEDPRVDRTKLHKLIDILVIAICAVICGADNWEEVQLFGGRDLVQVFWSLQRHSFA
jgi:hypothetical protein